jgi:hypothetical protein
VLIGAIRADQGADQGADRPDKGGIWAPMRVVDTGGLAALRRRNDADRADCGGSDVGRAVDAGGTESGANDAEGADAAD